MRVCCLHPRGGTLALPASHPVPALHHTATGCGDVTQVRPEVAGGQVFLGLVHTWAQRRKRKKELRGLRGAVGVKEDGAGDRAVTDPSSWECPQLRTLKKQDVPPVCGPAFCQLPR